MKLIFEKNEKLREYLFELTHIQRFLSEHIEMNPFV